MNKFVRCLSLFLTLVFLFQVPCCLAAEYAEQDEEIKLAVCSCGKPIVQSRKCPNSCRTALASET